MIALLVAGLGLWLWPAPAAARLGRARGRRVPVAPWLVLAVAVFVLLCGGFWVFLALSMLVATAWLRVRAYRLDRARVRGVDRLAETLRALVAELRRGAHPAPAADTVARDSDADMACLLDAVTTSARMGTAVAPAVEARVVRMPHLAGELRRIAVGWRLSAAHGLPLSELLHAVALDLDHRRRFTAAVRAQSAGARASGAVLALLPVLGVGLGELIGAHPVRLLTSGGFGGVALALGVGLVCAGVLWTAALTERVRP